MPGDIICGFLTTSLIIPGTDIKTLSLLLDLLTEGKSSQDFVSIESIQELAVSLGIDLQNVAVSSGPRGTADGARSGATPKGPMITSTSQKKVPKLKPTNITRKVTKPTKTKTSEVETLRNIKKEKSDEANERNQSKYNCEICEKTFSSINPLAYHYCKHFYKDLLSLNFPDYVNGNNCTKCNRSFADRKAVLCHVGVKHKYINHVLTANGLSKLPLNQDLPGTPSTPGTPSGLTLIKKEQAGVVLNDTEVRSNQKPKKQPVKQVSSASKARNSKEIKEIKICEICDKEQENMSKLVNHMIGSHLLTEIRQKYAHLYNGKECLECNKTFPRASVWQHLGAVHNKLDEVLIERGLRPIKVPPVPSLRQVFVKTEVEDQEAGGEQELQITNLFASYEAATTEGLDNVDSNDVEMATDPLV